MLKSYGIILLILAVAHTEIFAQFADIRGKVKDGEENVGVAFVRLKKGDAVVSTVNVSPEGDFIFSELTPGEYLLEVNAMTYQRFALRIRLSSGNSEFVTVQLVSTKNTMDTLKGVVVGGTQKIYVDPPLYGEVLRKGPFENFGDLANFDPKLRNREGRLESGDARPGQLAILNNGTIQIGPRDPTVLGIGQVKVIAVGVPAMYGDFVGGAVEYTYSDFLDTVTRRSAMLRTSSPFNSYHQNAVETYIYKPLIVHDGLTKLAITNSIYAGYKRDPNPTSVDLFTLSQSTLDTLLNSPFNGAGTQGESPTPNSYTLDQFERAKYKQNAASAHVFTNVGIAWKPTQNMVVRVNPSIQYNRQKQFSFSNSLLNSAHNPLVSSTTGKLNAQVIHTIKKPFDRRGNITYDSGLVSKINYVLTADYQRLNTSTKDPIHWDNIFGYGHIGSFTTQGQDRYLYIDDTKLVTDPSGKVRQIDGYYDLIGYERTGVDFIANDDDLVRSSITQYVMEQNEISQLEDISQNQGLLNGQNPDAIAGMWYAPGAVVSNYSKSDFQKTKLSAMLNLSVNPDRSLAKQHDVQVGMLFEQRRRSYYSLSANTLWQLMPQLLNQQFIGLDLKNPSMSIDQYGMFTDTLSYQMIFDPSRQTYFDKNLRNQVDATNGYMHGGAHFIDVNSVDPSALSIDMFTADELWNNGSSYLSYAGYDYKGKLLRGQKGIRDFLNDEDNRYIGGYTPNYSAVWVQDNFVLEKLKIRAGVRVERFDANHRVLKDAYSLYPVKSVAEVSSLAGQAVSHPSTIGEDAAVYVNDAENPTSIVGYREGNRWYDSKGSALASGESLRQLTSQGVIQPYLQNPNDQSIAAESFEDYTPEVMVLPRLSFSFPISSFAIFYAYYDKFSQRPSYGQTFTPINTYYYLENASSTLLPNPGLKPTKRTDYLVGYKQLIGRKSVLNLSVGYADIRDDINLVNIEQAYPRSYMTYGNVDFSTVKKFGVDFQMNLDNVQIKSNYLLQFADGTGSNANSSASLIQAGQPNLKSLYPLQFDVRHKLNVLVSTQLDRLSNKKRGFFKNMQANVIANAQSGSPFTAIVNAVPEAQNLGTVSRSQIKGNPFGSRMPWNYNVDMSISKSLIRNGKPVTFQLNVLNLLNLVQVYNVYAATASATNDGYLSSPVGKQTVQREQNAQSFVQYYNLKLNNPSHFGSPRMISLTIRTSF